VNGMLNPMYKQFMNDPALQQEMLNELIGYKVLASRADEETKKKAEELMAPQLQQVKDWLDAQGGLDKQLKDNKIELKDLEDYAKMSFYAIAGLEKQITDDQVKAEYDKALKENVFDVTTVRHILIAVKDEKKEKDIRTFDEALARAKEVQAKLKAGGDFDALAKEYSDDPGSKDKGGVYADLDYGGMSQMVPEFREAGFTLPVNQISEPVKTSHGYHVMRVDSRKTKTLEEMKQPIRTTLAQQKLMEFIQKEVPGLIETNNLPSPTPAPSATPEPSAAPSGNPAASPSPSVTPSP
jgi:foldase protein PrsA